jgi:hypothetical protein
MSDYVTKKIALPGGRVIDIVYFSDASEPDAAERLSESTDLHICRECEGTLVYPVSWEERPGDRWSIERRCPDCEWQEVAEFDHVDVECFDDVLNLGTERLLMALRGLSRANMEDDIERLIEAIGDDQILPMDF